jgi:hypothetical protein
VVEAARLVAVAGRGQILTTAIGKAVAAGRAEAYFVDLGPLELKGLPQPVAACEVLWAPLPEPTVPMPPLLTDVGRIFVGRDGEVERLSHLWKEAAAGERRVALLAGEPGVGKTRLAAEVAFKAQEAGATVLAGRCDEDLGVPYQPFVEALRHFTNHAPEAELPGRLGRHAGELVRLVPEVAARVAELPLPLRSDPETERYRLFDAVASWLAAASAREPVLLVLDDLQWAAKPTLLLLRHVVRSADPMRLLILGTYRDTELGHVHPLVELLADLRRQRDVERLSLSGLDQLGVVEFMAHAAGHEMDDEGLMLARAIHQETEGNPFFVREVIRHLTETGGIEQREGRWVTSAEIDQLGIPEGVREVVGRRLARLSAQTNAVLRVAAVIGAEFEVPVLQATGSLEEEALLSALEEAVGSRLVAEAPAPTARYRFAHALVRATLYDELTAARRVALHRKVAEAIEAVHASLIDDHLPALAYHWARASAPAAETGRAVDYARRAGDRALLQLAHAEAVSYYHQALELLVHAEVPAGLDLRVDLLIALGQAQRLAGDTAYRETLLEAARRARERNDADALAKAALAGDRGFWTAAYDVHTDRVDVLESALDAIHAGDSPVRSRLLACLGAELVFSEDRDRYLAAADGAVAMARRLGEESTLADALAARHSGDWDPVRLSERLAETTELLGLAEHTGDPLKLAWAHYCRFIPALQACDVDSADQSLAALEELSLEVGHPTLRWVAGLCRAGRTLLAGRLEEAEAFSTNAFETGRECAQPDAYLFYGDQRFHIRYEQDRLSELDERMEKARADDAPVTSSIVALWCWETGRVDDARQVLRRVVGEYGRRWVWPSQRLYVLTHLAVVSSGLHEEPAAERLCELLAPYRAQLVGLSPTSFGSVAHHLATLQGTLRRWTEAERSFEEAHMLHERVAAAGWLARTRLEWARMLLTRHQPGDAERARELLGQALATARELGLANVERRAVALLQ